ncbi:MAG: condensation domain-containing protein, partial [Acidobacteria bacterium]|nr:condensation domain-containing protein [Acidobacteriota bacterium]
AMQVEQVFKPGLVERVSREGNLPLSFAQQRLWMSDQLNPVPYAYNLPRAFQLNGPVNLAALNQSINEIVRRHEVLRTAFSVDSGEMVQVISPAGSLGLIVADLSGLSDRQRRLVSEKLATDEARRPFDLSRGPLLRANILRLGREESTILFTIHHIVTDGWSMGILARETAALYENFSCGMPSKLLELNFQYVDFAFWQREHMRDEYLETQLGYWKRHLSGAPDILPLPTDRPRPAVPSFRGSTYRITLAKALVDRLNTLSRREGATLFMTLMAGWQALLHHYTGTDEIVVGTDDANRSEIEIEPLIGFFVNQLPIYTNLSGNPTFCEILRRVREIALGAYAHRDVPFDMLVEELKVMRSHRYSPLFQVKLTLQNQQLSLLELPNATRNSLPVVMGVSPIDLTLLFWEREEGLVGTINYSTDLFDETTIIWMMDCFVELLEKVVECPNVTLRDLDQMFNELEELKEARERRERADFNLNKFRNIQRKTIKMSEAEFSDIH